MQFAYYTAGQGFHLAPKIFLGFALQGVLFGRVAGEVGNYRMSALKVEHLENGVVGGLILPLDDGVVHAALFDRHVVFKHRLAVQPNPRIGGRGNGNLNVRVIPNVLVDLFGVVGAKPQLPVLLKAEHKRAALCLSVVANGRKVLNRIFLQKFYYFIHGKIPPKNIPKHFTCLAL